MKVIGNRAGPAGNRKSAETGAQVGGGDLEGQEAEQRLRETRAVE